MGNRFGTCPVPRAPSIQTVRNPSTRAIGTHANTLPSGRPKPTERKTAAPAPPVEVNILFTLSNNLKGAETPNPSGTPDRYL